MTTIAVPTTVAAMPLRKPAGAGGKPPIRSDRLRAAAPVVAGGVRGDGRPDGERTVAGVRWLCGGGEPLLARRHRGLAGSAPRDGAAGFAAAADYWFEVPVRRFIAGSLAGVLPVSRRGGGAYAGLLAAARPALRAGRCVVIYPEGTRSIDGEIGEFHSGAVRLARECGVPIVPVAVTGTADVLPKGGSYRRAPMQVHIGEPVDADRVSVAELREQVMALRDGARPQNVPMRQAA